MIPMILVMVLMVIPMILTMIPVMELASVPLIHPPDATRHHGSGQKQQRKFYNVCPSHLQSPPFPVRYGVRTGMPLIQA